MASSSRQVERARVSKKKRFFSFSPLICSFSFFFRRRKLEETLRLSQALEKFVNDFRDLMSWIRETSEQISSAELAKDVPGAEALVQRHQEMRSEIETRKGGISGALAFGENLVDTDHYAKDEISTNIRTLDDERTKLDELWKARRHEFLQCLELQKFERDASAAEKWTAARELFLSGCEDDLGDSLDTVEALQKKHDDFEKSLAAQEEKITSLTEFARRLVSDGIPPPETLHLSHFFSFRSLCVRARSIRLRRRSRASESARRTLGPASRHARSVVSEAVLRSRRRRSRSVDSGKDADCRRRLVPRSDQYSSKRTQTPPIDQSNVV